VYFLSIKQKLLIFVPFELHGEGERKNGKEKENKMEIRKTSL
jgi:hypothetical protein